MPANEQRRLDAGKKTALILRVLRGEDVDQVAADATDQYRDAEHPVTVDDLRSWEDRFIKAGTDGLREKSQFKKVSEQLGKVILNDPDQLKTLLGRGEG